MQAVTEPTTAGVVTRGAIGTGVVAAGLTSGLLALTHAPVESVLPFGIAVGVFAGAGAVVGGVATRALSEPGRMSPTGAATASAVGGVLCSVGVGMAVAKAFEGFPSPGYPLFMGIVFGGIVGVGAIAGAVHAASSR